MKNGRGWAVIVAVALVLSSCSGSGSNTESTTVVSAEIAPTSSTDADTTVPFAAEGPVSAEQMDALAAQWSALEALPEDERNAAISQMNADFEAIVAEWSGLEAELGGPAAAATALQQSWASTLAALTAQLPTPEPAGFRRSAPSSPSIAAGLAGGSIVGGIAAEAVVTATNDIESKDLGADGGPSVRELNSKVKFEATLDGATITAADETTVDGVTTKLKTLNKVIACPDSSGKYEATSVIDVEARGSHAGQTGKLETTLRGNVTDDAEQGEFEFDYRMQWADFSGGKGQFVDLSGSTASDKPSMTVNRYGGTPTYDHVQSAATLGYVLSLVAVMNLRKAAEAGWKSGRCVRLDAAASPGPTKLAPGATSTITAAPRSKIDGGPTGGTVTATLASGGDSVDPSNTQLPADATFTYLAPDDVDQQAKVNLEERRWRRGIGKASIDFSTGKVSYAASGGNSEVTFSGAVDSIAQTFSLDATFQGGTAVLTFEPGSEDGSGGTYSVAGGGSGANLTGGGTYTIVDDGTEAGTLTLTLAGEACVDVSGMCRPQTEAITLTPT